MIGDSLGKYRDFGLLVIRVGIGAAFMAYGWSKLTGGQTTWRQLGGAVPFPGPVVWGFIAMLVELLGGLFIAIGFLFRPVCLLLFIQMMVAVRFHMRLPDPKMSSFLMGWSHAFELGIVFLGFLFVGPGRYSVDAGLSSELDRSQGFDVTPKPRVE
jgi:putative oxidoreductase